MSQPNLDQLLPLSPRERAQALLDHHFPDGIGSYSANQLLIGDGEPIDLISAASGDVFTTYGDSGVEDTRKLVERATDGAKVWSAMNPFQRASILRDIAKHVADHQEELALLESVTVGKPLRDTRAEAAKVAEMFGYYAGWADKVFGQTIPVPGDWVTYTQRLPYGVVATITPWNAPLFTGGWNSAAPLAAGNAVIVKPSELTPLGTIRLAQLAEEAGLPPGVFNVAVGYGHTVGQTLVEDPDVKLVGFIGSVGTGRRVAAAAAGLGKPTVLELGGKSANIVFADADIGQAVDGAISAIFSAAGQSCVAGSRLLVDKGISEEFTAKLLDRVSALKVGDPLDPKTEVGPIISLNQMATISNLVKHGVEGGAHIASSTELPEPLRQDRFKQGQWIMPTVLDNVTSDNPLESTEVFGPVLGVDTFGDEEEVVERANATGFGLASAVWTKDVAKAHRVANRLAAGTTWINAYKTIHVAVPFGGFGDSGYGRSSGPGVLDEYTQTKATWVPTQPLPAPFPSLKS